jgi:hypothetical protein
MRPSALPENDPTLLLAANEHREHHCLDISRDKINRMSVLGVHMPKDEHLRVSDRAPLPNALQYF